VGLCGRRPALRKSTNSLNPLSKNLYLVVVPIRLRLPIQSSLLARACGNIVIRQAARRRPPGPPSPDGTVRIQPYPYQVYGPLGASRDAIGFAGAGSRPNEGTDPFEHVKAAVRANRPAKPAPGTAILLHGRNPLVTNWHLYSPDRTAESNPSGNVGSIGITPFGFGNKPGGGQPGGG